jgi:hypothetical protein
MHGGLARSSAHNPPSAESCVFVCAVAAELPVQPGQLKASCDAEAGSPR